MLIDPRRDLKPVVIKGGALPSVSQYLRVKLAAKGSIISSALKTLEINVQAFSTCPHNVIGGALRNYPALL